MRQKTLQEIERDGRTASAQLFLDDVMWRLAQVVAEAAGLWPSTIDTAKIPALLRLCRLLRPASPDVAAAMLRFESVVRPALVAYLTACRAARRRPARTVAIRALVHHFDYHTKVPVSTSRIHRVLIWCWRTIRATRETFR